MSKNSREFFERIKDGEKPMGPIETMKEGIQAVAPGLSLSRILGDIGNELKNQAAHGSHEMAAALFNGNSFVMYPRQQGHDDPQHGLAEQQQEQDRGGREM
jgi:hypothetical protein